MAGTEGRYKNPGTEQNEILRAQYHLREAQKQVADLRRRGYVVRVTTAEPEWMAEVSWVDCPACKTE